MGLYIHDYYGELIRLSKPEHNILTDTIRNELVNADNGLGEISDRLGTKNVYWNDTIHYLVKPMENVPNCISQICTSIYPYVHVDKGYVDSQVSIISSVNGNYRCGIDLGY